MRLLFFLFLFSFGHCADQDSSSAQEQTPVPPVTSPAPPAITVEKEPVEAPNFIQKGRCLYVGTAKKEEVQLVYGIELKQEQDNRYTYALDTMADWKNNYKYKGHLEMITDQYFEMEGSRGELLTAYKFVGQIDTCDLILFVSKTEYVNSSIARLMKVCGQDTIPFADVFHNK